MQIAMSNICPSWCPCLHSGNIGDLESGESAGLKNRVSPYWQIIPAMLALIGCIIGIVCALLWNNPYLCLAFAPGVLGSFYLIYRSNDAMHLYDTCENLKGQVDKMGTQNTRIAENLTDFKSQNKTLKNNIDDITKALNTLLENVSKDHKQFADSLQSFQNTTKSCEDMPEMIKNLNSIFSQINEWKQDKNELINQKIDLNKEIAEQKGVLQGMQTSLKSLTSLCTTVEENLTSQIKAFGEANVDAKKNNVEAKETVQKLKKLLNQTINTLSSSDQQNSSINS